MNHDTAEVLCGESEAQEGSAPLEDVAAQRAAYKREYMRRWRANPANRQAERAIQRRAYHIRQAMRSYRRRLIPRRRHGKMLCGFCRARPSITQVTRLVPFRKSTDAFVEMKIPYCGVC